MAQVNQLQGCFNLEALSPEILILQQLRKTVPKSQSYPKNPAKSTYTLNSVVSPDPFSHTPTSSAMQTPDQHYPGHSVSSVDTEETT